MDIFTMDFLTGLLAIIMIDLVLAGDNAIVIAMAARNLPQGQQKKVILLGTAGAIVIRATATILFVSLLDLPVLMLAGGLILIWISYKLLVEEKDHEEIEAKSGLWAAIRTIIIADAAMGIDNVIAVAGAAKGDHQYPLVILGLLISVPIIVWGSTLFIKLINRFPWILYIGAGILVYTSAKMITEERLIHDFFENPAMKWGFTLLLIAGVLAAGRLKVKKRRSQQQQVSASS